jgi:transcriptional regulator with XRE-family HTH domain
MAENFFMRLFRENNDYSKAKVAKVLQMTEEHYADLESGNTFLKFEIAQKLDSLYKNDTPYCYIFGLQNELLETQKELFDLLKKQKADEIQDMPDDVEAGHDNPECNYDGREVEAIQGESTSLDEQDGESILLLDLVVKDPNAVIQTVFKNWGIDAIGDCLWTWLEAAICNNNSSCELEESRLQLMTLYKNLLQLVEALYLLIEKGKSAENIENNLPEGVQDKQINQAEEVIENFFKEYNLKRFRYLLREWLDAGISSDTDHYEKGYQCSHLLWLAEHLQCLVEAAFHLYIIELKPGDAG